MGLIALSDPSYNGGMTIETVWGAIANGRGIMVDSTGNRTQSSSFTIAGSTTRLSNAAPPPGGNMLGYANAIVLVYCLQSPVGLSSDTRLNLTIMARCDMRPINPIPGFLHAQAPIFQPTSDSVGAPTWMFLFPQPGDWNNKFGKNDSMKGDGWVLSHVGDSWLAGGWYPLFNGHGGPVPTSTGQPVTTSQTDLNNGPNVYGMPMIGSVYTSPQEPSDWTTNNNFLAKPIYYAIFESPISGSVCIVGFTNFEYAQAQATGNTGMVPSGAELALTYNREPTWGDFLPNVLRYTADPDGQSGPLPGAANYRYQMYYEVFRSPPPHGRPVYTNMYLITEKMYSGYIASNNPERSALTYSTPTGFKSTPYDSPLTTPTLPQTRSYHQIHQATTPPLQLTSTQIRSWQQRWGLQTPDSLRSCNPVYTPSTSNTTYRNTTDRRALPPSIDLMGTTTQTQLISPIRSATQTPPLMSSPSSPTILTHSTNTGMTSSITTGLTKQPSLDSSSKPLTIWSGDGKQPVIHYTPLSQSYTPPPYNPQMLQPSAPLPPLHTLQEESAEAAGEDGSAEDGEDSWDESDEVDDEPPPVPPTQLTDQQLQDQITAMQLQLEELTVESRRRLSASVPDLSKPPLPHWAQLLKKALSSKKYKG